LTFPRVGWDPALQGSVKEQLVLRVQQDLPVRLAPVVWLDLLARLGLQALLDLPVRVELPVQQAPLARLDLQAPPGQLVQPDLPV
jgi:hypothetical protein